MFSLDFLLPLAVRFISVQFGKAYFTIPQPNQRRAFHLPPSAFAVSPAAMVSMSVISLIISKCMSDDLRDQYDPRSLTLCIRPRLQ
jgi:hypothetical protein